MDYDYSELIEQTERWIEQAGIAGWIKSDASDKLARLNHASPRALFEERQSRPLIVAFMGGTGVGKSSLLNRLAGAPIARTGIERPTSREVTLFHHRSVPIRHLPENLPIASVKLAQHDDDAKKNIIWIDMPDFDSIEKSNKQLVLQWLPHIDVLIYVVSPERYRDDKAWRLLLAEGAKHAWLFALNQWDRGGFEQYEDFKRQLNKAGFDQPLIYRTICGEERQPDEFQALAATLTGLANDHVVGQLEQIGLQARKDELRQYLEQLRKSLGDASLFEQAPAVWHEQWQRTAQMLQQGFSWPLQQLANYYADHAGDLTANPTSGRYPPTRVEPVWDDWAQSRLDDALDEFIGYADHLGVPVKPVENGLAELRAKAAKIIQTQTELGARTALANPGNKLQRIFLTGVRIAEIILPVSAIGWVAYQVFIGYYHSNQVNADYLGINFAIHSTLLIAISWLFPWILAKKLKPSLRVSALRGLNSGLLTGLGMIDAEVAIALDRLRSQHARQLRQLSGIIAHCGGSGKQLQTQIEKESSLNRMLIGMSSN
ncbi:MAG: GTPase [Gammaproteobacteria bacterium]